MKKSFILLPALMMVLTACGGTTSDGTTTTTEPGTTTTTTEPGTTTTDPVEENNVKVAYEAAAALANKTESANAYDFDGVVIAKCGNSFFVYKDGYSMYVYSSSAHEGVEVGKTVAVNAKVKKYNGIIETGTVNSVTVTGEGVVPTATTITSAADLGALKQNVLVNYVGAIPADAGDYSAGNSPLVNTVVGEDTITTKFDKAGYNDDNGAAYLASKGHKANFTNVIATAFSTSGDTATNQLLFVGTSTLALVEVPATAVTLTADKEEATVGETVTFTSTVTPAETTDAVKYEITAGADHATLNGNVLTTTGAGTVTVVAKAGTVTSNPVTITVSAPADNAVSIAVTPTTLTKKVGQQLTTADLVVTVTRESGATEVTSAYTTDVVLPYTFTDADATAGTKTVTVSYPGVDDVAVNVTVGYMTVAEVLTAAEGVDVTLQGVVKSVSTKGYVLSDETGSVLVHENAVPTVTLNQFVKVTATVGTYSGVIQLTKGSTYAVTDGVGTAPTIAMTPAALTTAEWDAIAATVNIKYVKGYAKVFKSGNYYNFYFHQTPDGAAATKTGSLAYPTTEMNFCTAANVGKVFQFEGFVCGTTGTRYSVYLTTFAEYEIAATVLTISSTAETVEVGKTINLSATLTPAGATSTVTYSITSGSEFATVSGNVLTGVAEGTVTIVGIIDGTEITSDPITVTVIAAAPAVEKTFTKVTAAQDDWSGEYLLVYEDGTNAYAFNGLDAVSGCSKFTISENTIKATEYVSIIIEKTATGYAIKLNGSTNDGKYIGGKSGSNALNFNATAQDNTIEYDTTKNWVKITSNTSVLTFNNASNQMRFRYYKAASYGTMQVVQLYKIGA